MLDEGAINSMLLRHIKALEGALQAPIKRDFK
jgi:hypothetical protein